MQLKNKKHSENCPETLCIFVKPDDHCTWIANAYSCHSVPYQRIVCALNKQSKAIRTDCINNLLQLFLTELNDPRRAVSKD